MKVRILGVSWTARWFVAFSLITLIINNDFINLGSYLNHRKSTEIQPNIILIVTDDLDVNLNSPGFMPILEEELLKKGVQFTNFFAPLPMCCPSRASILLGQYPHNHEVYYNKSTNGGFSKFLFLGHEEKTLAASLQSAGYRKFYFGKYLNNYEKSKYLTHVPSGWDEWYAPVSGTFYRGFDYTLNENGTLIEYGSDPEDYLTDVIARKASEFIEQMAYDESPFFMVIAPTAPHAPAIPAPRHETLFWKISAPRTPSFNESDVSDKPLYIRQLPLVSEEQIITIDRFYRKRLRTLQSVDEMIGNIINTTNWRKAFPIEFYFSLHYSYFPIMFNQQSGLEYSSERTNTRMNDPESMPLYFGFRTAIYKFIQHANGEIEFYDLIQDPYELENKATGLSPELTKILLDYSSDLFACEGDTCRVLENAPPELP